MRILGVSVLGLLELTACARAPDEARHTVEEYRGNPALRHAEMERCRRDPGTLRATPDCVNAETAASFDDRLRLRDTPPVGLESEPAPPDPRHGD